MEKRAIKLGEVALDAVVQETPSQYAEITDKPVEKGSDVSDHMRVAPSVIELSGTMVEDASSKLQILKGYQRNSELLRYVGRNIYDNMVIEDLETDHAVSTAEGYHYEITLRSIRIARPEVFGKKVKNPKTNTQDKKTATRVKEKTNIGRQQPEEKKSYPENKAAKNETEKDAYKRVITPAGSWDK